MLKLILLLSGLVILVLLFCVYYYLQAIDKIINEVEKETQEGPDCFFNALVNKSGRVGDLSSTLSHVVARIRS